MGDYHFANFRLRSELELAYLRPWSGPQDGDPDITIALGKATPLQDAITLTPYMAVDGQGGLCFQSRERFTIRVSGGRQMTVDLTDLSPVALMHMRVLTLPLGFICYHLGAPPLHGGLVEIDGRLLAICAPSGAGKSTLVATLLERGNTVLSDDLCITEALGDGGLLAYPGVGTLKLLPQSVTALGLDITQLEPEGSGKYILSTRDIIGTEPRRLNAVIHIEAGADVLSLTRVPLGAAPGYLDRLYYRPYLAHGLPPKLIYGHALRVFASAPLHLLTRPNDLTRVHEVAACVEDFARGLPHRP